MPLGLLKRKEVEFTNDEDFIEHFLIQKKKEEEEKRKKERLQKLKAAKNKIKALKKGAGFMSKLRKMNKSPMSNTSTETEVEAVHKAKEKSNQIKE